MTTTFLDATDAPISATIGVDAAGKPNIVKFPLWTTNDLKALLSRRRAEQMAILVKYLDAKQVAPQVSAMCLYQEEIKPWDPFHAHQYFMSIDGADECLIESLKKTGIKKEEAQKIIEPLAVDDRITLAIRVAHIYRPKAPVITPPSNNASKDQGFGEAGQTAPAQPVGFGDQAPAIVKQQQGEEKPQNPTLTPPVAAGA